MKLGELIEALGGKLVAGEPELAGQRRELFRVGLVRRDWSLRRMRHRRARHWRAMPEWLYSEWDRSVAVSTHGSDEMLPRMGTLRFLAGEMRRRGRSAAALVCARGQTACAGAAGDRSASGGGCGRKCEAW